jgi:hypothetical protein
VTANSLTPSVSAPTRVVATLRYQNVTLTDTAAIQVVATPPTSSLAAFVLHPGAGFSPTCNLESSGIQFLRNCGTLVVDATTEAGGILSSADSSSILVAYKTSNPLTATVDAFGSIREGDTGHVTFVASTWAYGVGRRDSLRYTISWPRYGSNQVQEVVTVDSATVQPVWSMPAISIAVGGTVAWINQFSRIVDITFDDPAGVEAGCFAIFICTDGAPSTGPGNVPGFYTDLAGTDTSVLSHGIVARSFPVAGTYRYHSTRFSSLSGVIYVRSNLQP